MTVRLASLPRPAILTNALYGALLVLLVSVTLLQIVAPTLYPRNPTVPLPLKNLLPVSKSGWDIQDMPLAATEELQEVVVNILRYDDTIFRVYTRGSISFSIYVSYWLPGKVSYFDAGLHTPDTCWVYTGWKRLSRESGTSLHLTSGRIMKPAETGIFTKGGQTEHVAFWHLVGGRVNTYQQYSWKPGIRGRIERLPNYFKDFFRYGLDQSKEQCFVRLSSPIPIVKLLTDPEVVAILDDLSPLGIFEPQH